MAESAVVGIGHDLQLCAALEGREALLETDVMFTGYELGLALARPDRVRSLATLFSAKEAFFKAIPRQAGWLWCELELWRDEQGRPQLRFSGELQRLMIEQGWDAAISISHSGDYVSTVVLIQSQSK